MGQEGTECFEVKELAVLEEQLHLKEESLKLQKWHVYAIWIGLAVSLLNVMMNTVNIFLIITHR